MKYFFPKAAVIFFIFMVSFVLSQDFVTYPLISLPGQNRNFDVKKKPDVALFGGEAGICFENYNDGIYSICFKQIKPYSDKILFVAPDSLPKGNPTFTWLENDSIRIVWQQLVDEKWQIFSGIIIGDSLTPPVQLTQAAENNISPQISANQLIWINDLYLTYAEISDSLINIKKIDGSDCSNPDMHPQQLEVLYEQQVDSMNNIIKQASYISSENRWALKKLINRGNNKSPRYDSWPEPAMFTYQKHDTVWKSFVCELYNSENVWESNNHIYNNTNPFFLYYPIPTKKYIQDWFVVYESDSLEDNREIIAEISTYWHSGTKINLSDMPGDDSNPYALILKDSAAVIWEHADSNGSQIYWARAPFKAYSDIDENGLAVLSDFTLKQNYPNPFNPSTAIEFYLPKSAKVSLSIYNVTGEKIKILISSENRNGANKIIWNGNNENGQSAASGIYFYVLDYGKNRLSKKMLLLR